MLSFIVGSLLTAVICLVISHFRLRKIVRRNSRDIKFLSQESWQYKALFKCHATEINTLMFDYNTREAERKILAEGENE